MQTFREGRRWVGRLRLDPVTSVEWVQHGKTALAGTLAWLVARDLLGMEQPFLAPWAAVLVVHATIYRTVSRGGQQVVATVLGVLLAWAAGTVFGIGPLGMAVLLAASFLVGRHRWLVEESTTVATTGIVVLATNAIDSTHLLGARLLDTGVGIVVGLAVNLVVWPPLRDRAVRSYVRSLPGELAGILASMSEELGRDLSEEAADDWVRRCREVDVHIDHAWGLLRLAQESSRMNPRRSQPADLDALVRVLHVLENLVAESLSLARTVATSASHHHEWEDTFRSGWQRLLATTAQALEDAEPEALRTVRDDLDALAREFSTDDLARRYWHEYGGVLVDLRNIVDSAGELATWVRKGGAAERRTRFDLPRPARLLDRERVAHHLGQRLRSRIADRDPDVR